MQQPVDYVISFDDTGSMSTVRREVRRKVSELVNTLFEVNPLSRIAIIYHNDYVDRDPIYIMDFTTDKNKIISFVNGDSSCGGASAKECYEYVLHEFRNLSWQSENRVGILIGDELPHEKGSMADGRYKVIYDWREECNKLAEMSVKVYGIQALSNRYASHFYEQISTLTGGQKLDLKQFSHITQYITAISHQQSGTLDEYQKSSSEFSTNLSLKTMFSKLKRTLSAESEREFLEATILASKFQVLDVLEKTKIKAFVENTGIKYRKGKGYYQLIMSELIQADKEVLFVDKETGETIMDTTWCRVQMGLPYGTKGKVNPKNLDCAKKYDIFVQSNSYTRDLDPGTKFLYELDAY